MCVVIHKRGDDMSVIKWVMIIMLLIAFLSSLGDSCSKANNVKHRTMDLIIAIVCFVGMAVMRMFWW